MGHTTRNPANNPRRKFRLKAWLTVFVRSVADLIIDQQALATLPDSRYVESTPSMIATGTSIARTSSISES